MPDETPATPRNGRRRFLRRVMNTALGTAAIGAYGHYVAANDLTLEHVSVPVGKPWTEGTPPLKIAFLSDFHCDSEEAVARTRRAVALAMAQRPDIVILGGDYITWYSKKWVSAASEAIAPASGAPFGAYGILGNHDCWSGYGKRIAESLERRGIRVLRNQSHLLETPGRPPLWLVGLDDVIGGVALLPTAMAGVPADAARLLLVHEPDYADRVTDPGFFLQISGHSHAGQVRVFGHPLYCPLLGRKYSQGLMRSPTHPVYTTRGVGMMAPQIRIDCAPEVTLLTLTA